MFIVLELKKKELDNLYDKLVEYEIVVKILRQQLEYLLDLEDLRVEEKVLFDKELLLQEEWMVYWV